MDHAEVRSWLEDSFFRPGVLHRLADRSFRAGDAAAPEHAGAAGRDRRTGVEDATFRTVREHLSQCDECTAELEALRRAGLALDLVMGPAPAVRGRVLGAVGQVGRERRSSPARRPSPPPLWSTWLTPARAAAAVLIVAVLALGVGALVGSRMEERQPTAGERLERAITVMADLAAEPATEQIVLHDRSGARAGLALVSSTSKRLAVMTTSLTEPTEGRYACYLERDGRWMEIGPMHFADGVAFWAGPLGDAADMGLPGDRFIVAMEDQPAAEPMLMGEL